MTLSAGTRLGAYEILGPLGAGGMGEVYRANDTKLGRDVAIKVLPGSLAADPERLARFEREARVLASLNHTNIAAIYGVEDSTAVKALVLELVEGPTLQDRIEAGAIPPDEALPIARQIAEALEAAHEKGIIHRDLKPANVKLDADGNVKVLDFGLAKALDPVSSTSSPNITQSPTMSLGTQAGTILGTAPYMSPEQARGKPADKRADIWAFGVVLFEMLTGRRLFAGETVSDTLAAVLRNAISFDELPPATPPQVRALLSRCLERDPKNRLRDIGEARVSLDAITDGASSAPPVQAARGRREVSLPILASALALAMATSALFALLWAKRSAASERAIPPVTEFSIPVDGLVRMDLSPDGRRLSWVTRGGTPLGEAPWTESGKRDAMYRLWLRDLDDRVPRELARDATLRTPIWSPDGSQIAVQIGEQLWRIPVAGGERTPICDLPKIEGFSGRDVLAGVWMPDDTLLFAAWRGGVYRVPARGGSPELFVPIDPKVDVDFHKVLLLPDGKSLMLLTHLQEDPNRARTLLGMRIELVRDGRREALPGSGELANLAPIGILDGTLVLVDDFSNEASTWGVPFDAKRGVLTGRKFLLIPRVDFATVGADGTLAWVPLRERPSIVTRVDRAGTAIATLGEAHPHLDRQALSPDGSRLAVVLNGNELWVRDLGRGTLTRLVTAEKSYVEDPQWGLDGRAIYYSVGDSDAFWRIRAEPGAIPERFIDNAYRAALTPKGSGILVQSGAFRLSADHGLSWAPLDSQGHTGPRKKLLPGIDSFGRLAPDERILAYGESLNGRGEAFLATFPALDQTIQLSAHGGGTPQWSADGKSVYYLAGGSLVEVEVGLDARGRLTASPERKLFDLDKAGLRPDGWSTAPRGSGFIFLKSLATDNRSEIVVARNGLQRARPPAR